MPDTSPRAVYSRLRLRTHRLKDGLRCAQRLTYIPICAEGGSWFIPMATHCLRLYGEEMHQIQKWESIRRRQEIRRLYGIPNNHPDSLR